MIVGRESTIKPHLPRGVGPASHDVGPFLLLIRWRIYRQPFYRRAWHLRNLMRANKLRRPLPVYTKRFADQPIADAFAAQPMCHALSLATAWS